VRLILETPRLVLREMSLADLDFVAAMLAHLEVMQFWPKPFSRAEEVDWIRRQQERYARDGFGYWLALDKTTRQPIGQAGLLAQEIDGVAEVGLGYIIHRPFWRRGFATEAAAACRDCAFERLGKRRVITLVRPENVPSQGVALKLGMKLEKRVTFAGFEHLVFAVSRTESSDSSVA
jgi:ribosomal-protein-alanine N-acetyltransferase